MLYEVKIKKPDGTVKKVVSKDEVDKVYWDHFFEGESNIGLVTGLKAQVPNWVKKKLDLTFPDNYELTRRVH